MSKVHRLFLLFLSLYAGCSSQARNEGYAYASDSTPVYFRTFGSGPPLLIINGGPGMNSEGFSTLASKLSTNHMTIIYDQRGTGGSLPRSTDTTTITMQHMMDDIERLRRHLKIEKWSILGHSFGGMLASYYATQHPDRVDKLILSSSGGIDLDLLTYVNESINSKLSKEQLDSVNYWTAMISRGDTSHHAKLERGRYLAHAYVVDPKFIPIIAERLTQGNMAVNQLIWTDLSKINFDCSAGLMKFDRPVLIIQGRQDIIKSKTAEKAHKALKNSRIVYMDHCVHYGWLDNEQVYFGEINSFLEDK